MNLTKEEAERKEAAVARYYSAWAEWLEIARALAAAEKRDKFAED